MTGGLSVLVWPPFYQPRLQEGDEEAGDGAQGGEDHGLHQVFLVQAGEDGEEGADCCTGQRASLCTRGHVATPLLLHLQRPIGSQPTSRHRLP